MQFSSFPLHGRTDFTLVLKIRSLVFADIDAQGLPGFAYPAVYICIGSTICEMATLPSS